MYFHDSWQTWRARGEISGSPSSTTVEPGPLSNNLNNEPAKRKIATSIYSGVDLFSQIAASMIQGAAHSKLFLTHRDQKVHTAKDLTVLTGSRTECID
jgi:hypothetical protein